MSQTPITSAIPAPYPKPQTLIQAKASTPTKIEAQVETTPVISTVQEQKLYNHSIRQQAKQHRQSLSHKALQSAEQRLCVQLKRSKLIKHQAKIAYYLASAGEISCQAFCQQRNITQLYLPKLYRKSYTMRFHPRKAFKQQLKKHRWGMLEPTAKAFIASKQLDVILLPLSAFDQQGHRLGLGGGYYDRALAFTQRPGFIKPILIGLAHESQQAASIKKEDWDIAVDFVVTDRRVIHCQRQRQLQRSLAYTKL